MGVYIYSARSAIRNVEGVSMGEYKFAYKPGAGWYDSKGFNAQCARMDARAYRAADKLNARGVRFMVAEGFPKNEGEWAYVREFDRAVPSLYSDGGDMPGSDAGVVRKVGRKLVRFPSLAAMEAIYGEE